MNFNRLLLIPFLTIASLAHANDAGEDITISFILKNVLDTMPPLLQAVFAIITIVGLVFIVQAAMRLPRLGKDPQVRIPGIIVRFIVGVALIFPVLSLGFAATGLFGQENVSFIQDQINKSGNRGSTKSSGGINDCLTTGKCTEY